ncbi:hypothetical protein PCNPT3_00560 [Psychromonas sp. CNPT3]|nr:hypothetical protein PCNPT3_00560 [Psychromonas sp. CNPT3]
MNVGHPDEFHLINVDYFLACYVKNNDFNNMSQNKQRTYLTNIVNVALCKKILQEQQYDAYITIKYHTINKYLQVITNNVTLVLFY